MADNRAAAVLSAFADLQTRASYIADKLTSLREPLGFGDTIYVPAMATPTVYSDGATHNPDAVSMSAMTLVADKQAFANLKIPRIDDIQIANGAFTLGVAKETFTAVRNDIDNQIARNYLAKTLAYSSTGAYHDNVAGAAVTSGMLAKSIAQLAKLDGVQRSNLAIFAHPMLVAEISAFKQNEFTPAAAAAPSGALGVAFVGSVHGVPVYESQSILSEPALATTAAVTSGSGTIHTYTVAAGHGQVPGVKVTVAGHDADENVAAATAITSVGATSIVVTTTATADGTSSDADGTIGDGTCWNLVCDVSQIFIALQKMPGLEFAKLIDDPGWALQVWALYGRIGRPGRCRVLHSSSAGPA